MCSKEISFNQPEIGKPKEDSVMVFDIIDTIDPCQYLTVEPRVLSTEKTDQTE